MNAIDLLSIFRNSQSEEAFTELVRRYTNLVYSAAHRRLSNRALAEDVTQMVFIRLAKVTPQLRGDATLVAWLHRTTMHVAIDVCRSETRRHERELKAVPMESTTNDESSQWLELAPKLDEVLDLLKDEDRQALLLRFFAQKRMAEVGQGLGVSEDAAKMRVSRALQRLREQLELRGVACTTSVLTGLILAHSVEAAPVQLLSSLNALHLSVPSNLTQNGFWLDQTKLRWGLAGLCGIGLGLVFFFHQTAAQDTRTMGYSNAVAPLNPPVTRPSTALFKALIPSSPEAARLTLQIIDSETREELPDTKVVAVYFYAGGVSEGHSLRTDLNGRIGIPEPNRPEAKEGMNVYISAEFHVPICLSWHERNPTNRTIKLDPALTISGVVVDDAHQPVPNVAIELSTPGIQGDGPEHVAFNGGNTEVITDAAGRWRCPYIPRHYDTAKLILTCEGYAVTLVDVPVVQADSTNATLIIKRGSTIIGCILDSDHQPIFNASVTELHTFGYKKQATHSDADGAFILQGLWDPLGTAQVMVVVQAQGLAPQARTIQLLEPTNKVNFILNPGRRFRGRITNATGDPIPNATIRTDTDNHGIRKYEWLAQTDIKGRFEWDSAPEESVLFWFEAPDYKVIRDLLLETDESDHEIVLEQR